MNSPSPSDNQNPNNADAFQAEAFGVLGELQPALAAVLERLRPAVARPADLHYLLKLDHKLSWSIYNAAHAPDARSLPSLLPGRRAMERFFVAAGKHGASGPAIARARAAFERFEESVARHARRREAFDTMVAELGNGGSGGENSLGGAGGAESTSAAHASQLRSKHKRSMFRAASLLWGREARVGFASIVVHPNAQQPELLDSLLVKGMMGLHQTVRGVPLHAISRRWNKPTTGDPAPTNRMEPLDPREAGPDSVGLLRDFCSEPFPTFRTNVNKEGYASHELVATGIGASSEVTYFTGHILRACAVRPGSVPGAEMVLSRVIETPMEVSINDCLMHESVWDETLPEVKVFAWPYGGLATDFHDSDLLPIIEWAEYLGRGLDPSGRTPLIPRYAEMMSYAMRRVGWNPDEFRIFRCRVAYPVLSSRIRVTFTR